MFEVDKYIKTYKTWRMADIHSIEQMKKSNYSMKDIAGSFNVSVNAVHKVLYRYKKNQQRQLPIRCVEPCDLTRIMKLADEYKIPEYTNIVFALRDINKIRMSRHLSKLILKVER